MLKTHHVIVFALAFATSDVFALGMELGKGDKGDNDKGGKPTMTRAVSWDELRARCASPEQFDVQRAPQNIRIQCTDVQREFIAVQPGEVLLPSARMVASAVFSDKFHVDAQQIDVPVFAKGGSCMRFKEVEKTLAVERGLTCSDILGNKGDANEFCIGSLDRSKGSNPKLASVVETGTFIDTCPPGANVGAGKPGKGGDGK
jgi:hypothetical protein